MEYLEDSATTRIIPTVTLNSRIQSSVVTALGVIAMLELPSEMVVTKHLLRAIQTFKVVA